MEWVKKGKERPVSGLNCLENRSGRPPAHLDPSHVAEKLHQREEGNVKVGGVHVIGGLVGVGNLEV